MTIQQLKITNFRNIASADIYPTAGVNLLVGENASGKTSILEAIYLLSMVRSFRSKKIKSLIQHATEQFTVFGSIAAESGNSYSLGVQRHQQSADTEILFRGQKPAGVAEVTAALPVQLINPDAFRLLEGSPKDRRQFLDWGVFHVEHSFIDCWKRFQRALKQRNSLLRHGRIDQLEMSLWEKELSENGEKITALREEYLTSLKPLFAELLDKFLGLDNLTLSFQRGWDKNVDLVESLFLSRTKDREQGFTQAGPQRADVRVAVNGYTAMDILSRGQQKLVVSALKLAQGALLSQARGKQCVYLIDDLPAELDKQHRKVFCEVLEKQSGQVFITGVDAEALAEGWLNPDSISWFHVEQGQVSPKPHLGSE
ncbi:DNA replication/repair protein RecF [Marinospirillum insulare]|uniref:DNA replication and repair protein RecF n=1 Tax=Marinospirillum insulare TaxID=217169 RepID=A0ABQ6A2Q2_9GAMM|nr:DNA replication/repair protein RecF [Marinospirillum insulare]GLR64852.1 DNA replication and repair protein RecF [Marinospirillum insulare]